jgi:tRNA(Ile)-lysidine synthase
VFEQLIQQTWPHEIWHDTRILVAVSGGADSVALLRGLLQIAQRPDRIEVAHFNHCWRGAESDGDQQFVVDLCRQLAVALHTARADEEVRREPLGRNEESAREARYAFLTAVAYKCGARYVATAHTATDRVETLLHNLFRGTGLGGVCSPTLSRPLHQELVLVRPLLACTRKQVVDYLHSLNQTFRTDSSNENQAYRRNFIRNSLLPLIRQEYGEHLDEKILSFSEIAEEAQQLQQELANDYLGMAEPLARQANRAGKIPRIDRSLFVFPNRRLLDVAWPVVRQALYSAWLERDWPLQKMSRAHWNQIRSLWQRGDDIAATSVAKNLPGNIHLSQKEDFVILQNQNESVQRADLDELK